MVVRFRKQAFKFLQRSSSNLAAEIQQQLNQIDAAIGPHTEVAYEALVELLDRHHEFHEFCEARVGFKLCHLTFASTIELSRTCSH